MDTIENGKNSGVIINIRPSDFMAGAETAVVYDERLPSGDWEPYKPTDEWQRKKLGNNLGYDTLSCVTFSALNSVEQQITFLMKSGRLPITTKDTMQALGYLDENGLPNFSDWFSSIVDGTTVDGNFLQAPWDSFRKFGALPQKDGKSVNDFNSQAEWLNPANITQEMRDKALRFIELFDIFYEWVALGSPYQWGNFNKHVKHAPLHVLLPTCSTWNTHNGTAGTCAGVTTVNHAVLYQGSTKDALRKVLDHYDPFIKRLASDYYIPFALKGVVSVKKPTEPAPPFHHIFTTQLRYGMGATDEVHALQQALQTLNDKNGKPYMQQGLYGRFGGLTRVALGAFQTENGIKDPDGQGTNFGKQTRAAMNLKLNG